MTLHVCMLQIIIQTLLKSLLAFVHSNVKTHSLNHHNTFCVHQHGDHNTGVSGKLTELYGAASDLYSVAKKLAV